MLPISGQASSVQRGLVSGMKPPVPAKPKHLSSLSALTVSKGSDTASKIPTASVLHMGSNRSLESVQTSSASALRPMRTVTGRIQTSLDSSLQPNKPLPKAILEKVVPKGLARQTSGGVGNISSKIARAVQEKPVIAPKPINVSPRPVLLSAVDSSVERSKPLPKGILEEVLLKGLQAHTSGGIGNISDQHAVSKKIAEEVQSKPAIHPKPIKGSPAPSFLSELRTVQAVMDQGKGVKIAEATVQARNKIALKDASMAFEDTIPLAESSSSDISSSDISSETAGKSEKKKKSKLQKLKKFFAKRKSSTLKASSSDKSSKKSKLKAAFKKMLMNKSDKFNPVSSTSSLSQWYDTSSEDSDTSKQASRL